MNSEHCQIGSFKRKKSVTKCDNCRASYNNASVPEFCTNKPCNSFIGGSFVPKKKQKTSPAFLITECLASVRTNEKGRSTRTFVSIGELKKVKYRCKFWSGLKPSGF